MLRFGIVLRERTPEVAFLGQLGPIACPPELLYVGRFVLTVDRTRGLIVILKPRYRGLNMRSRFVVFVKDDELIVRCPTDPEEYAQVFSSRIIPVDTPVVDDAVVRFGSVKDVGVPRERRVDEFGRRSESSVECLTFFLGPFVLPTEPGFVAFREIRIVEDGASFDVDIQPDRLAVGVLALFEDLPGRVVALAGERP